MRAEDLPSLPLPEGEEDNPPPNPLPAGRGSEAPARPDCIFGAQGPSSDVIGSEQSAPTKPRRNRKRKLSFSPSLQGGGRGVGCHVPPPVSHLVTGQKLTETKAALVRKLRSEMTPAEQFLWAHLRGNRLSGFHFRRQHPVHGFVADFYCHAAGVVVEVDGGVHNSQAEYDAARDLAFKGLGLLVLRFRNEEVTERTADVLSHIETACANRITRTTEPYTE